MISSGRHIIKSCYSCPIIGDFANVLRNGINRTVDYNWSMPASM